MDGRSPKLQRLCAGTKLQMKQSVTASRKKFIAKGPPQLGFALFTEGGKAFGLWRVQSRATA